MRSTCVTALAVAIVAVLLGCAAPGGPKPIREDDRAYSISVDDRGYIAARCAALYSATAQTILAEDADLAETKQSRRRAS